MTAPVRPLGDFLGCLLGPVIWAGHFFIVYGAETVVCLTTSPSRAAMQWTVIVATATALLAIAAVIVRYFRSVRAADGTTQRFLRTLAVVLAALSAAAILAVGLAAFGLPACLPPAG
jgi:hypothetical protein